LLSVKLFLREHWSWTIWKW